MSNFVKPHHEEKLFTCNDCEHIFQEEDCKEGMVEMVVKLLRGHASPLPPPFGPKCPNCGNRNTRQLPPLKLY